MCYIVLVKKNLGKTGDVSVCSAIPSMWLPYNSQYGCWCSSHHIRVPHRKKGQEHKLALPPAELFLFKEMTERLTKKNSVCVLIMGHPSYKGSWTMQRFQLGTLLTPIKSGKLLRKRRMDGYWVENQQFLAHLVSLLAISASPAPLPETMGSCFSIIENRHLTSWQGGRAAGSCSSKALWRFSGLGSTGLWQATLMEGALGQQLRKHPWKDRGKGVRQSCQPPVSFTS